jgi:hypothetical protein
LGVRCLSIEIAMESASRFKPTENVAGAASELIHWGDARIRPHREIDPVNGLD